MSSTSLVIFLACVGVVFSCVLKPIPRVTTDLGDVSGYYKRSKNGIVYAAYEGIPYAQAPVGELRFQPPREAQPWDGELTANEKGAVCTQYRMNMPIDEDRVTGCEDCLFLNIYVPGRERIETLFPVMFWIHGGAFQFGSGNEADEKLLMDRDIVFVTFNYRLGPFGFLSTASNVVPGNMGLKDQSMALKWVTKHIQNFGGNPKNITIFGLDAGSASTHYHYMSSMSTGLFQRGISISGVSLNPWAQTKNAQTKAKHLASVLGCSTETIDIMIACLRERPARQIAQAVGDFMYWLSSPFTPFGPVVEKQTNPTPFINRSPIESILRNYIQDLPWICGVVSEEGLFSAAEFITNNTLLKQLNDNWTDISPYLLDYNETIDVVDLEQTNYKIRQQYFGDKEINQNTAPDVVRVIGDRLFKIDTEKSARVQSFVNTSPVWAYNYKYRAKNSYSDTITRSTEDFGVSHGDDIFLVIDKRISNTDREEDLKMQQLLIDFYTTFAITGEVKFGDAKWEPMPRYISETFHYLNIANPTNQTMVHTDDFASKKFWRTISFQENLIYWL